MVSVVPQTRAWRQWLAAPLLLMVVLVCGARGQASAPAPTIYTGACDASAVVALNSNLFAIANDEDNVIRIYRRSAGGGPVRIVDLTAFLRVAGKNPETDLEGAARIGDRVYWISSHGRNAKGKESPSRQRFFATTVRVQGDTVELTPVGQPYVRLLADLLREPRLRPFNLFAAARRAPKAPGALNIEGLCFTPENHLLIGFRNPIPQGRALVVPLLDADELLEGKPAKFGDPILLDLGGLGVRSMGFWKGRYLIVAGSYDGRGESRLYEWSGGSAQPRWLESVKFDGLNPEGVVFDDDEAGEQFHVVSDDGTRRIAGQDCKRLKDPSQRRFRSYLLTLGQERESSKFKAGNSREAQSSKPQSAAGAALRKP
jgi:hypothetical protein